jgi:hypothetical protein
MKIWVEKTIVNNRIDRIEGSKSLGNVLWSPQKDKRGGDIYKNMREVSKGDLIIHLIDNKKISGTSIVSQKFEETEINIDSDWDGPVYIVKLENYKEINPMLERSKILNHGNEKTLKKISSESEVFYNRDLKLRQGAYLTPCPIELFELINSVYKKDSNQNLPNTEFLQFTLMNVTQSELFKSQNFNIDTLQSGLVFGHNLILRLISSLLTKPFVILTGLSGSGKTKLAQAFAMWICEDKSQYNIVPVGADWTNREPLLGFPNALKQNDYVKPESKVLELILNANSNPEKPYFLILDEMNLSHVERYFADFLSVMESKSEISLHSGTEDWNGVPSKTSIPPNLFMIGTVNIDETTYMFSPKVLDRANVIEFRVDESEMESYLENYFPLDLKKLEGNGAPMATSFVDISQDQSLNVKNQKELNKELLKFFAELKKAGTEFGYRSASEILRFAAIINKIEPAWENSQILDASIMQKLLPKVHGSRRKLEPILKTLGTLCLEDGENFDNYLSPKMEIDFKDGSKIKYPVSLEKIIRMYSNLISNGFTSYAEA